MKQPNSISTSDRLTYYAVLVIERIFALLPTSLVWRFGYLLGLIAHFFASKRRKIVAYNLTRVHPDRSKEEITRMTKKVFCYSMANLTSSVNTGFISNKRVKKLLKLKNEHHLTEVNQDKGIVFLLFHMGNWEVLGRLASFLPTEKPTAAMYRPLPNPLLDNHIQQQREQAGTRLFSRKRGLIEGSKFLKAGGILGVLSDQYSGSAGVQVPLFGKDTSITPLPAILAQKYNCPIIPISLKTIKPGRWLVECHQPVHIAPDADKTAMATIIAEQLEKIMLTYSNDMFWIHDRWKIKREL